MKREIEWSGLDAAAFDGVSKSIVQTNKGVVTWNRSLENKIVYFHMRYSNSWGKINFNILDTNRKPLEFQTTDNSTHTTLNIVGIFNKGIIILEGAHSINMNGSATFTIYDIYESSLIE